MYELGHPEVELVEDYGLGESMFFSVHENAQGARRVLNN